MKAPAEIAIRPMEDADVPAVVDLLAAALGPGPGGADRRELFEWKHLRGPFGRSLALVAESDDRLVGLRAFMRWRLAAAGAAGELPVVRAVDTATSPGARRRGVFSSLTKAALTACADEGVAFVFNTPNDRSLPGYLKMGWREVARWPMRVKVRRPVRLLGALARRELASGAAVASPAGSALAPASEALEGPPAERFAAAVARPARGLFTPRTIGYLRWRYAEGPLAYHALIHDDPPRAMVIARLRARGRLREAVVCEALHEPGAEGALAGLLRRLPAEAAADHAVAHFGRGWGIDRALAKSGYRSMGRPSMTFTARPVLPGSPNPLERGNWSLSLGDLEVF